MGKYIKGVVTYQSIEGGFWGISTEDKNYFPIHMHEQLKHDGKEIECSVEILDDVMTMQSWGVQCRIISFETIYP